MSGYELDTALRNLTERLRRLELKEARNRPASGVTVSDPGGFFGGPGGLTMEEVLALIGAGTAPTGFLRSTLGEVHVTATLDPMGATAAVDLFNANWFYGELLEDCTISTTGWTNLKGCYIHLELAGGAGGFLPTVDGVTWVSSAPVAIAAGESIHLILYSRDGGTTIWGSAGGAIATDGLVPYLIEAGETYTVPVKKQALKAMPITVDAGGSLVVDGFLLEVA